MFRLRGVFLLAVFMLLMSSWPEGTLYARQRPEAGPDVRLADHRATKETRSLYRSLLEVAGKGIYFGQQDATMYGIGWKGDEDRSDIKSVTGVHPALYGWDIQHVIESAANKNDYKPSDHLRKYIKEAYDRAGINTISWHAHNFVTGNNFYDTTVCVAAVLPGGIKHDEYKRALNEVARFMKSLKGSDGKSVPVIFRPFHEHTGSWFWWGRSHCSTAEYIALWRFTVSYLRDSSNVHNLIYAYSPDRIGGNMDIYLERYPGDDYVDVLGFDNYWELKDMTDSVNTALAMKSLRLICDYARSRNKVAALTETGQEKLTDPAWFSSLLARIKDEPGAGYISYMMVWRNAHTGHFYAPYSGHASAADFLNFFQDPLIRFGNKVEGIYKRKIW